MKSKFVQKLLVTTAVLTMIAGATVQVTPVIAHADETTQTINQSTDKGTVYNIGAIKLPTSIAWNGDTATHFVSIGAPITGLKQTTFTKAEIEAPDFLDGATLPSNVTVDGLRTSLLDMMGEQTYPAEKTLAEYLYDQTSPDVTLATYKHRIAFQTYFFAWTVQIAQKYLDLEAKLKDQSDEERAQAEEAFYKQTYLPAYQQDVEEQVSEFKNLEGIEWMETAMIQSAKNMDDWRNLMNYLTGGNQNVMAVPLGISGLDEDLSTLNPKYSQALLLKNLDNKIGDYLTTDANGVTTLDMNINQPYEWVFGDKMPDTTPAKPTDPETPTTPEQPTTPDKPTTPVTPTTPTTPTTPVTPTTPTTPEVTVPGETGNLVTGGAGDTATTAVKKGTVVLATKKLGLYSSTTFTTKTRKQWYARKAVTNRPMFVVTGTSLSKTGHLRYRVKDVNHQSVTAGKTGYITANRTYVTPAYYQQTAHKVTVLNPRGVNAYRSKQLTKQTRHYRQGQVLRVKKIVHHHLTTRFQLTDGTYVTANKQLVATGQRKMVTRVQAKQTLNRYTNVGLTHKTRQVKKGQRVRVDGWAYSNANRFDRTDALRYHVVGGGYITANHQFVKIVK